MEAAFWTKMLGVLRLVFLNSWDGPMSILSIL